MKQVRPTTGRYDRKAIAGAHAPAGLGQTMPSLQARTAVVSVPDPYERGKGTLATVNRAVDLLEMEHACHRIDVAAYEAGKRVQIIFEKRRGPGATNWQGGDRVDASVARDTSIERGLEVAQEIQALRGELQRRLGPFDARIVEWLIGEGRSYAGVAALTGPSSERRNAYIAQRFRDALVTLSDAWAARGRG